MGGGDSCLALLSWLAVHGREGARYKRPPAATILMPPVPASCSDDATFNMDEWVLNTEAHPLRVSQPPQGQQAAPDAAAAEAARKKWWWPPGPGQAGLATGEAGAQAAVQQQRRRAVE